MEERTIHKVMSCVTHSLSHYIALILLMNIFFIFFLQFVLTERAS